MEKMISEFNGQITGFEGSPDCLNVMVDAAIVHNGGVGVTYVFPFVKKEQGMVRLNEYAGKCVKVTVEMVE